MARTVNYIDKGLIDYKEAWDFQEVLFKKSIDQKIAKRDGKIEEEPENQLITTQKLTPKPKLSCVILRGEPLSQS